MLTKKTVLENQAEYKNLINAVIRRVGMDSVEDINKHDISGGYGGFIYYTDTVKFFNNYKTLILRLAEEMASGLGEDMLSMIQNFDCLTSGQYPNRKPDYTQTEIAQAIFAGKGECVDQIKNALAWFAAEEVCRFFEE